MNIDLTTVGSFTVRVIKDWIELRDANGRDLYYEISDGYKLWSEYEEGDLIHGWDTDGWEEWFDYDNNHNCIHYKNSDGYTISYNSDGETISSEQL